MRRNSEKLLGRVKVLAAVVAVAVVALASLLAAPQRAQAEVVPDENDMWLGYYAQPLKDSTGNAIEYAGFEWVEPTETEPGYYKISNPTPDYPQSHDALTGWRYFAQTSREHTFDGYLIRLAEDLDFSGLDWGREGGDRLTYTVGSDDMKFSGTFDGQGHTLKNFTNYRDGLDVVPNCGFFGTVNDAVIKNTTFFNCYVGTSFCGGVVAGQAIDTLFMNLSCENCTLSIVPGNNVINLITNAGLTGGMIVGDANGSTLYDCEMVAGRVVTNATAGLAALGGQPLYLGGLVGGANDTTIEYCRVRDGYKLENGNKTTEREFASVRNRYDTAASVANYTELFTGGIVGAIQAEDTGTKIVDCYCTADVESYAAIRFAVGLGLGVTRGYTGGIVGIVQQGSAGSDAAELNLIQRVSYAGNLHSYNYNVILLGIPTIEHDKYMGGITGRGGDNAIIDQAYFMRGENDLGFGSSTDEDFYAVKTTYGSGYMDGTNFGSRDSQYADREGFWETKGFDFAGGTLRNVGYKFTKQADPDWTADHYNKWVMDYSRGIPVHGGSIKATMDFPGSGSVTIGTTTLAPKDADKQTTDDPYDFAVQGYASDDKNIAITYTQKTDDKNDSWAADDQNQGFKFLGWYYNRDVRVNDLAENHSLFTTANSYLNTTESGILSEKYKLDETDTELTVTEPIDIIKVKPGEYEDNDLYVAYVQAQVLLHDVDGNVINKDGTTENADYLDDDWYAYEAAITLPTTVEDGNAHEGTFVGWTTRANTSSGSDRGHDGGDGSATPSELQADGVFWEPGATFTVTEPANLYPVYSNYPNIEVIYEGHERDNSTNIMLRETYGEVTKENDSEGHLVLDVVPAENSPLADGTVRFLGWYEYVGSAADPTTDYEASHWLRVSRGEKDAEGNQTYVYDLTDAGIDLNAEHIYMARFEYLVDYMYYPTAPDHVGLDHFAQIWERYGVAFENITGPSYYTHGFLHWSETSIRDDGIGLCDKDDGFSGHIYDPHTVYAHNDDGNEQGRVVVTTDFPSGPTAKGFVDDFGDWRHHSEIDDTLIGESGKAHRFYGWTGDVSGGIHPSYPTTSHSNPWIQYDAGWGSSNWWIEAHVTARVNFHGVYDSDSSSYETTSVERTWNQGVFLTEDTTNNYTYHYKGTDSGLSSQSAAFPFDTDMSREGYIFLGWIDATVDIDYGDHVVNGSELVDADANGNSQLSQIATAFADGSGAYLANSYDAVSAYLMTGEETCTRPMDLYPVYLRAFELETSTNIHQAGVDSEVYNIPDDPALSDGSIDENVGSVTVDYNKDGGTVHNDSAAQVTLTYNDAAQAKVDITVDLSKNVWQTPPDGAENEKYTFVSLTVLVDGEEAETIPASRFSAGTLAGYVIEAGHSYEFRANYSPVPVLVTYHLNADKYEIYDREVGDLLPAPQSSPSFSVGEDEYFVGWTVDNVGTNYVRWSEGVVLASPGSDTVTGTMHLWPVYRTGDVPVNSNIDESVGEDHRYTERRGEDIYLVAEDVAGYRFEGWYTGYGTGGEQQITTAQEYAVTGDARFSGTLYTAVYTNLGNIPQVQYHDTQGNVIYTAYAEDDDADRTFYETIDVDVPVYDENGNQIDTDTVQQSVIIDVEAFSEIASSLMALNEADNATSYQEFLTWQWVDADDITPDATPQRWGTPDDEDNFVSQKVSENAGDDHVMHLYPVTVELTAESPSGEDGAAEPYAGSLSTQLTMDESGSTLTSAAVTLRESYAQPWLKVHLDEVAYGQGDDTQAVSSNKALTGIPVTLNGLTGEALDTDTTRSEQGTDAETGQDLDAGDAIFSFGGRIQITKRTQDARAAGQTFTFTVSEKDGGGSAKVSVTVGETPVGGWYSGSATIEVPFGAYTVSEDSWAWRYVATVQTWAADADTATDGSQPGWLVSGDVTVSYGTRSPNNADGRTSVVRVTNALANGKWFDGSSYVHNVFGKDGE